MSIEFGEFKPTHPSTEPPLSNEEVQAAKKELVKGVSAFPRIKRRYVDPLRPGEPRFALFSFIERPDADMISFLKEIEDSLKPKHKKRLDELNARPQSQLMKGVAKIRGAYMTEEEAGRRAEEIIKDIDSSNSVYTCMMGVPFPLVTEGMAEEVSQIDLQNQTEHAIAQNVRQKRQKEQKEMEDIKSRQEELLRNAEKDPNADDEENYIAQRVKLAHLRYAIEEHVKRHAECVENEKQVVAWLLDMKSRNPQFEEKYIEKYMAGRKAAHIPDDHNPEGFMKYMNDPLIKLEDVEEDAKELEDAEEDVKELEDAEEDVKHCHEWLHPHRSSRPNNLKALCPECQLDLS